MLARTGEKPERTPRTGAGPRQLASLDETVREARLFRRYYSLQGSLHSECFYNEPLRPAGGHGAPDQADGADYIDDAERLAEGETP